MSQVKKRIDHLLNKLFAYSFEDRHPVSEIGYTLSKYKKKDEIPINAKFSTYKNSAGWGGGPDEHYWFVFTVDVPKNYSDYVLSVKTGYGVWHASNPQFLVYIDGELMQGLDENHTEVIFKKAGHQTVWLYAYTGSETCEKLNLSLEVIKIRRDVRRLFYQLYVLSEVIEINDENSRAYQFNLMHLEKALSMIDFLSDKLSEKSVQDALEYLDKNAVGFNDSESTIYCLGQTHIDVEWLWTLQQTKEKVQRSFSNVLELMDRFKDYPFFASTPILYEYIKETQPKIHEKIISLIKDGRWEADGAMWLEADNVLSSGESLIRQIMYGKQYFKKHLNKDSELLWLPDCFGFSGAFPQIAKKTGIKWFITSKISWNDTNQFPHDIFEWQGIDGSKINTYFLTTQAKQKYGYTPVTAYNGMANAKQLVGTYDRLSDKQLSNIALTSYGWGDGGGGPTESMYEQLTFMRKGVVGLPKIKPATLKEFFVDLEKQIDNKKLPKWIGELYMEYHRGTYTAVAKVKKMNRHIEFLLSQAEMLCALNDTFYEKETLERLWKVVLTHQFHDALPGSSIKAVYDNIEKDYAKIEQELNRIIKEQTNKIISRKELKGDVVVFNFNSQPQSGLVKVNSTDYYVENVPAKGYKTIKLDKKPKCSNVIVNDYSIENDLFKVIFDNRYEIVEFIDKRTNRNVVKDGGKFNVLKAYNDINREYDAWELSSNHMDYGVCVDDLQCVTKFDDGYQAGFIVERKFRSSTIKQKIALSSISDLVTFDTDVDWQENCIILKAEFDTDIMANYATYNIQFGNIERSTLNNTSYETAQFEVPFHKFYDLSEGDYGLSIINDCKYGGIVKERKMSLSLIRSPKYPYADSDKGEHKFAYHLLPHIGDYRQADTVNKAYNINNPLFAVKLNSNTFEETEYSLISVDKKNIIVETIKPSENNNCLIFRLYEGFNAKTRAQIKLAKKAKQIFECDMLENDISIVAENTSDFDLQFSNYEIKTIKVVF